MRYRTPAEKAQAGNDTLVRNIPQPTASPVSNTETVHVADGFGVKAIQQPRNQYQTPLKVQDTTLSNGEKVNKYDVQPFLNDKGTKIDYEEMKSIAASRAGDIESNNQMAVALNKLGYKTPDGGMITPANISVWASDRETSIEQTTGRKGAARNRLSKEMAKTGDALPDNGMTLRDTIPDVPLSETEKGRQRFAQKNGATETLYDPAYNKEGWTPNARPRMQNEPPAVSPDMRKRLQAIIDNLPDEDPRKALAIAKLNK